MRGRANRGRLSRNAPALAATAALVLAATALAAPGGSATASKTLAPHTFGAANARCPHGTRPAFGGFRSDFSRSGGALPVGMAVSGRAWRFGAANNSGADPHAIRSIAYCSKHPPYTVRSVTKTLSASSVKTIRATCPRGSQLLAGGYRGHDRPHRQRAAGDRHRDEADGKALAGDHRRGDQGRGPGHRDRLLRRRPPADRPHRSRRGPRRRNRQGNRRCPRRTSLVFGGFVATAKLTEPHSKLVAPGRIARGGGGWAVTGVNATRTHPARSPRSPTAPERGRGRRTSAPQTAGQPEAPEAQLG